MKKFNQLFALVCTVLLSVSFVACSSDSDDDATKPAVTVTVGTAGQTTLSFTVTPTNAQKCAWVCLEPGEKVPTAEQILANEINAVSATEPTFVEVTGLTPETEYTIVAAVSNGTTYVVSAPVSMVTLDVSTLTVSSVSGNITSGFGATREAALRFFIGSGSDVLEVPVLFDSNEKYLPAGTYTIGTGEEPGVIDNSNPDYCYFYYGGALQNLTDGTMTVDIVDGEYDINFEFTTTEGEFKVAYKGDIDGIKLYFDLSILDQGRRATVDGEVAGQYCIKLLESSARNEELTLNFYADASSTTLPAGTYTVGTGTAPGTLGAGTEFTSKTPKLTTEVFASGSVVVTKNGETYTFVMQLYNEDGYAYKGTFTGEIAYMVREEEPDDRTLINFDQWRPSFSDQAAHKAAFYLISTESDFLNLVVYTNSAEVFLPAGTYTVGTGTAPGTIAKGDDTTLELKANGWKAEEITEGTLTVTVDGEVYTLVMDLTVESGKFRCKYVGDFKSSYEDD